MAIQNRASSNSWGALRSRLLEEFVFNTKYVASVGGEKGDIPINYGRIMTFACGRLRFL